MNAPQKPQVGFIQKVLAFLHFRRASIDSDGDASDIALARATPRDGAKSLDDVLAEIEAERELQNRAR